MCTVYTIVVARVLTPVRVHAGVQDGGEQPGEGGKSAMEDGEGNKAGAATTVRV